MVNTRKAKMLLPVPILIVALAVTAALPLAPRRVVNRAAQVSTLEEEIMKHVGAKK